MATRQQLQRAADLAGCTVSEGGSRYREILIDAPDGHRFGDGDCHQLVGQITPWAPVGEVYGDMIARLGSGIYPCPDDCECRDE